MQKIKVPTKQIQVCTGPGCKAWKSENLLALISLEMFKIGKWKDLNVCEASCMNKCGGGISIKTSLGDPIFKVKSHGEISNLNLQIDSIYPCKFQEPSHRLSMENKDTWFPTFLKWMSQYLSNGKMIAKES